MEAYKNLLDQKVSPRPPENVPLQCFFFKNLVKTIRLRIVQLVDNPKQKQMRVSLEKT